MQLRLLKKTGFFIFVVLIIIVGFYPLIYFFELTQGLLSTKSKETLADIFWRRMFNLHIGGGGLALLFGWPQFNKKWRSSKPVIHRNIGKVYVAAVSVSSICGLYIAFYATGGLPASLGFAFLAVCWFASTSLAYIKIRQGKVNDHEKWMVRSFALCLAAVTLRIYLPIFQSVLHMDFVPAYRIISWLCWVPNLLVAEWIIRNKKPVLVVL